MTKIVRRVFSSSAVFTGVVAASFAFAPGAYAEDAPTTDRDVTINDRHNYLQVDGDDVVQRPGAGAQFRIQPFLSGYQIVEKSTGQCLTNDNRRAVLAACRVASVGVHEAGAQVFAFQDGLTTQAGTPLWKIRNDQMYLQGTGSDGELSFEKAGEDKGAAFTIQ
jgi:hypothetical protein